MSEPTYSGTCQHTFGHSRECAHCKDGSQWMRYEPTGDMHGLIEAKPPTKTEPKQSTESVDRITHLCETCHQSCKYVSRSSGEQMTKCSGYIGLSQQNADDDADVVNHPSHYTQGKVECIDAIRAMLTADEFRGYCKGNAIKYIWRERHKGGDESIEKAAWYIKAMGGAK